MAYGTFEDSAEGGRPIELYTFTIGASVTRYTSAEDTVTYSANQYLPRTIDRSAPTLFSGDKGGASQLEVTMPADDPIAARYIGIVPPETVHVQIIRFHRGDSPNGEIIWDGRIISAKFVQQGARAILYSVSSESALSRPVPGRKYQSLCNHVLYDALCQVNKASYQYTNTVTDVTGDTITVSGLFASKGDDWAQGGTIEFGDDKRLIVDHTGDVLTLNIPFYADVDGETVDVYAGCAHDITTCNAKFSNAINYGGFPYVPHRNILNLGLE
ncbi:MAG: DUF2163 domain-containing protein [bacterium]|nr:DUF2163 domain-containing protein [bacterium]